ncbi:outer membrane beta-barrel family protein [uncultured Alistipes sp.]|uniref:outer membrane beta-barrel family protein n=1 Tax=uncultured Alistipes sp. TaxID=538949 RepID=UPI0025B08BBB|nr:outer membrane beta-barrel family protein [uncultured Alistipes sp.]
MKKLAAFIVIVIMTVLRALGAQNYPATGRVVTQQGDAVEFATVVLLQDGQQTAGTATDTEGRFALKVPAGDYTLSIRFIGFEPLEREVRIESPTDLGDLTLSAAATQIDDVVVSAQLIRREADRFVVDVANTPAMLGRDGIEALKLAPGIWMDGDKISINGKSGSKVYVNDRELRMEPDQLLSYLQSLRAEDIQKIEVIPMAGADYDADSSGGVIRITLRKRREQGTEGSVSLAAQAGEWSHGLKPQASVNHHSERFDFYANAWGHLQNTTFRSDELTRYTAGDTRLESHSRTKERSRNYGFKAGGICELTPKHSIGLEADYWRTNEPGINDTHTDFTAAGIPTRTESRYDAHNRQNNLSATFNYIFKLDTAGSTLKLLADYNLRTSDSGNDNSSRIASPGGTLDSLYRNRSTAHYNVATATLALDKHFGPKWTLRTGAKYTYNDMRNHALYEYRPAETWLRDEAHSFRLDYTEHIAAVYGIVAANLGRWSAVAGLRGEYTRTAGKNDGTRQDYFSLFPNASVSYALTRDGAYSLIGQYARTIGRPRFWCLNPQRVQISDYTYQTGNPELEPSYKHDVSLTLVLAHKYTLTGGVTVQTDEIQQTIQPDPTNPDMLQIVWVNFDTTKSYYASASIPLQPTRWWSVNLNGTYIRQGQRIGRNSPEEHYNFGYASASMTFTLPAKFYIDLSYRYQSRVVLGNCWVEEMHFTDAGIKKRFGDNLTVAFTVRNPIAPPVQKIGARGDGFVRHVDAVQTWNSRTYQLSLSYRFRTGKAFRHRNVEAGSAEEKSRL